MSYRSPVPKEWMIGTIFKHSPKAVKAGERFDSVFPVVAIVQDQGRSYYLGWKCSILKDGKIKHPAYKRPLSQDDKRLFIKQGRNGSKPTAMFRPDSFYNSYYDPNPDSA